MRVLHVGKYYYPRFGGIETFVRNLAEGLRRAGDDVTVLCAADGVRQCEDNIDGVRVLRLMNLGTLFSQPLLPTLPYRLIKMHRDYDLIHIHSPNPLAESAAMALSRSVPVVVTYHSDIVRQSALRSLYQPMLRAFLSRSRNIVVGAEKNILHSNLLPGFGDKCQVVPFGLSPEDFEVTPAIAAKARELRERHGPYVLFVGRLVGYKGVEFLLQAMKDVPARLLIVGDGPLREKLETAARSLGLADKARFLGEIADHADLISHYHGCEFLVLPSITRNEAMGLVLIEAMACGKPVITTRLSTGVSFVNEDGVTGLHVHPRDSKGLSEAIRKLLADTTTRERMAAAARARFHERFRLEPMVESYRSLYRVICGSALC